MANVIESLPNLNHDQLREVVARARYLLDPTGQQDAGEATAANDDEQLVWDEITAVLKKAGDRSVMPLPVFLRTKHAGKFRKAAKAVVRMVRDDFQAKARVERLKVVRLLVGLAAKELDEQGRPVGPSTLTSTLCTPCAMVDRNFPYYRTSHLLPMLVKKVRTA